MLRHGRAQVPRYKQNSRSVDTAAPAGSLQAAVALKRETRLGGCFGADLPGRVCWGSDISGSSYNFTVQKSASGIVTVTAETIPGSAGDPGRPRAQTPLVVTWDFFDARRLAVGDLWSRCHEEWTPECHPREWWWLQTLCGRDLAKPQSHLRFQREFIFFFCGQVSRVSFCLFYLILCVHIHVYISIYIYLYLCL